MSQYTTRDVPTTKSPNAFNLGLSTDKQHLTQYRLGTRQRTASIPSGILFHPIVWPQYTNVADRQAGQDNGPVAQGEPLLITVAQKAAVDVEMFSSCHGGATGMASMAMAIPVLRAIWPLMGLAIAVVVLRCLQCSGFNGNKTVKRPYTSDRV